MKVGQYMNIISDQAHAKRREHFINILTMVKNPTAIPELVVENKNAQRVAKKMLENIEDYF